MCVPPVCVCVWGGGGGGGREGGGGGGWGVGAPPALEALVWSANINEDHLSFGSIYWGGDVLDTHIHKT